MHYIACGSGRLPPLLRHADGTNLRPGCLSIRHQPRPFPAASVECRATVRFVYVGVQRLGGRSGRRAVGRPGWQAGRNSVARALQEPRAQPNYHRTSRMALPSATRPLQFSPGHSRGVCRQQGPSQGLAPDYPTRCQRMRPNPRLTTASPISLTHCSIKKEGLSGSTRPARKRMEAGMAARPRLSRQPQSGMNCRAKMKVTRYAAELEAAEAVRRQLHGASGC